MTQEVKHYWLQWAKAVWIRVVRTFASTALGVIGGCTLITEVNWMVVLSSSLMASIIIILASLSGLPEVEMPTEMIAEQFEASDAVIKEEEK